MEQDQNQQVNKNVALLLTDRLKTAWRNFMEEFQQTFDVNQLDSVLSLLKELDSTSQNSTKKKRVEFMQKGDGESQDNNDENSSSLEKKVFGNHLLAKSVFKCLSPLDLFSCRLMNSYWNEYATEVLLKGELKILFTRKSNRLYLNNSNWKSLDMFTELLKRSKNFPCNKFVFKGGNLGNDDAQRFFSFYGPSIKNIEIILNDVDLLKDRPKCETGFSVSLTDSRVIGMILSQQLPNLEDLTLNLQFKETEMEWTGSESLLFPPEEKVELPHLKRLTYRSNGVQGDDALLRQILVAATNLTQFDFRGDFCEVGSLDNFIATGKVNCINALCFPAKDNELDKLEEMLKYEPKLSLLYARGLQDCYKNSKIWTRISRLLTQLLNHSQNSLETIFSLNSLGFLPKFQLPVLPNVTELDFNVDFYEPGTTFNSGVLHDYSFSFLPRGASFSVNFPRLHDVTLEFDSKISGDDAAAFWKKSFPTHEIVPTVKKLEISEYGYFCPLLWMEKLCKMFPNLEDLYVSDINDFPKFSKIIWTSCRKLKKLIIGIHVFSSLNSHPALDSSFTGLSPEVCKQLGELSTTEMESMAENYMENHEPSLLNLTGLRSLYINLQFSLSLENYNSPPILTPLTGICVFKPLESLEQVTIHCSAGFRQKMNESLVKPCLEPLTPYKVKLIVT